MLGKLIAQFFGLAGAERCTVADAGVECARFDPEEVGDLCFVEYFACFFECGNVRHRWDEGGVGAKFGFEVAGDCFVDFAQGFFLRFAVCGAAGEHRDGGNPDLVFGVPVELDLVVVCFHVFIS